MNHYSVDTGSGKIELSKGTYLTMMKRKLPAVRTLSKHKPISAITHAGEKRTVKKPMIKSMGRSITRQARHQIMMLDGRNNPYKFHLTGDRDIFDSEIMLPNI
jgi:hypothetical protein